MNKTFHFISGLPRSGSTLLANILAQNPRFCASGTSGVLEVLFGVRNNWDNVVEFKAMAEAASEAAKLRVLRGVLDAYYADDPRPVVFDKSRSWLACLEMAEAIIGRQAKVLAPIRDLRDVLASFEKLWRATAATRQVTQEAAHYFEFQTLAGRLEVWARGDQPVGLAYNRIKDAIARGYRNRLHLVRFEELTRQPRQTLQQIYAFLEEDWFEHDFEHVEQVIWEDDRIHGFPGLHRIRPKVEPLPPQWPAVLGPAAEPYANLDL